jgi:hypothetical protein
MSLDAAAAANALANHHADTEVAQATNNTQTLEAIKTKRRNILHNLNEATKVLLDDVQSMSSQQRTAMAAELEWLLQTSTKAVKVLAAFWGSLNWYTAELEPKYIHIALFNLSEVVPGKLTILFRRISDGFGVCIFLTDVFHRQSDLVYTIFRGLLDSRARLSKIWLIKTYSRYVS